MIFSTESGITALMSSEGFSSDLKLFSARLEKNSFLVTGASFITGCAKNSAESFPFDDYQKIFANLFAKDLL